jgi:hypothetical protein
LLNHTANIAEKDFAPLQPTTLGKLTASWTWRVRPGQVVFFQRSVAVVRSDSDVLNPDTEAREKLGLARRAGWRAMVAAHEAAWASRWESSDIEVEGDIAAQRALRFAIYHLNSAANPTDERVSIGARALTGDDYRGHVFWDTEIFLLPFYVLTWPEAARALLMYRFRTLDGARAKAVGMGWRGALYAWESADTGAEATPDQVIASDRRVVDILCGRQEQHISADVAYAVWQYWQATGDEEFLRDAGGEIILGTGRFWASRAQLLLVAGFQPGRRGGAERFVEDRSRCDDLVTLWPEMRHFFVRQTSEITARRRAVGTRLPQRPMSAEVAEIDHCIGEGLERVVQLTEAFEPEQQVAKFVLPAKHTLNGVEPFLEDRQVEKWLAATLGGSPVPGIRVDVRHHAAIENRLPVTDAIVNAIQAHGRAAQIEADETRDPRHFR